MVEFSVILIALSDFTLSRWNIPLSCQFLGLMKKRKQVIETIYSPGVIVDSIVHHNGTGFKGNCSQEHAAAKKGNQRTSW